jgi:hypothetical protein
LVVAYYHLSRHVGQSSSIHVRLCRRSFYLHLILSALPLLPLVAARPGGLNHRWAALKGKPAVGSASLSSAGKNRKVGGGGQVGKNQPKEKPGILVPVRVKTSIPAFRPRRSKSRVFGGIGVKRVCAMHAPERNALKSKRADLSQCPLVRQLSNKTTT